jgi:hypothetical protein
MTDTVSTPDLVTLVQQKAWLPLSAVVIGFIIRILKDDQFVLPPWISLPSQYRAAAALALGVVAGVINLVVAGTTWDVAIPTGLMAGAMAIFGDTLFIQALRKGKDLGK